MTKPGNSKGTSRLSFWHGLWQTPIGLPKTGLVVQGASGLIQPQWCLLRIDKQTCPRCPLRWFQAGPVLSAKWTKLPNEAIYLHWYRSIWRTNGGRRASNSSQLNPSRKGTRDIPARFDELLSSGPSSDPWWSLPIPSVWSDSSKDILHIGLQ